MGLSVRLAQQGFAVGDLDANVAKLVGLARDCDDADLLLTPEFCVCGYPPEDLMAYEEFIDSCSQAATKVADEVRDLGKPDLHMTLGFPRRIDGKLFNVMQVVSDGRVLAEHRKVHLPNHGVFDEKRYFAAGSQLGTFKLKGKKVALAVCHDIWDDGFAGQVDELAPDLVAVANASPFYLGVQHRREELTTRLSARGRDVAYVNMVGAQDEHVYDGGSHLARDGKIVSRLEPFEERSVTLPLPGDEGQVASLGSEVWQIERALVTGIRAYVNSVGDCPVFIGLSGGIDSAVVACLAVSALGARRVVTVSMPSAVTSDISNQDAAELAGNLGTRHHTVPIEDVVGQMTSALEEGTGGSLAPVAVENIQSRIRGTLLMGLANSGGGLVLTTGNKSEMATGYATLYGDMAGAFDVLKDITKRRVYELARHLNEGRELIPDRMLTRPPTAELRHGQLDSDSLPAYASLDQMIERIVENLESPASVARDHGSPGTLLFTRLLEGSEFKRRQAPIGPTVTKRAFGKSWRMPVCNRFTFTRPMSDADDGDA